MNKKTSEIQKKHRWWLQWGVFKHSFLLRQKEALSIVTSVFSATAQVQITLFHTFVTLLHVQCAADTYTMWTWVYKALCKTYRLPTHHHDRTCCDHKQTVA